MSGRRLVAVVGDVVLDRDLVGTVTRVAPDAPVPVVDVAGVRESPGGAGLTAVLCALGPGVDVVLVAPVADDEPGRRLAELLGRHVRLLPLPHEGATRRKSRVRAAGQSLLRLDDGGPGAPGALSEELLAEVTTVLEGADAVLVSDYGAGTTRQPQLRALLERVARRRPVVWDPHPRGGQPVPGCTVVTPNLAEARAAAGAGGEEADVVAGRLRRQWSVRAVCVTAGERGAFLAADGSETLYLPAPAVEATDPCGAGDRFAATLAVGLARAQLLSASVADAVADASAWVAAGGSGGHWARTSEGGPGAAARPPSWREGSAPVLPEPAQEAESLAEVAARLRAGGGTLVATGGCFDVLHAGHVACLAAARRLGDALVVLINSDESVRRLKGPTRPAVGQADRARVLAALASVDAVAVFPEDDPRRALAELRPDVWAKGGDYGGAELPEAELVRSWGGRVVLLPYLAGRSTTGILQDRRPAEAAGQA